MMSWMNFISSFSSYACVCAALLAMSAITLVGCPSDDEGETTVVNLRETDGRLGPLVTTLVTLGAGTLLATMVFWWMTRPKRRQPGGTPHG